MTHTLNRSIAPEVHPIGEMTMPRPVTHVLPNGLTLHVIDRGEDEVNRLTLLMPGGSAESGVPGLAELGVSGVLEGTSSFTSAQVADTLDFNGSWAGGSAHTHHHSLNVYSLNSRMERVMPLLLELAASPSFPEHETEVAREKAARALELSMQKVAWLSQRELRRLVMGEGCPLVDETTVEGLRSVTPDMLRRWHAEWFDPARTHLFLAGRITPEIERMVADGFGSLKGAGTAPELRSITFTPNPDVRFAKVEQPESLQTAVSCGLHTIGRTHPDYVALRLVVTLLGGYFGSRLMLNIREDKGYTYGISAALMGYRNEGMVTINTECDNRYADAVLEEISAEIRRLHDASSYDAEELARARSFITTSLAAQLDSPFAVADYYVTRLAADIPDGYFEAQQHALAAMTPESLAEIARRYLDPDRLYTALAGR